MAAEETTTPEEKKVEHPKVEEIPAKETSEEVPLEEKKEDPVPAEAEEKPSEEAPKKEESTVEESTQELSPETEETFEERPLEEEVPLEKTNKKLFIAGFLIALLIFGLTAGVFYLANRLDKQTTKEVATEIEEAKATPTATPGTTQLTREEITLEILNGSGVSGAAAETAATFEDLGYEVVKVGNAEDTEGNQLYINADVEDLVDALLEDADDELDISSVSGELEDSTVSARIILGK